MISQKLAAELIKSLSWMFAYPTDSKSGFGALVTALLELAADEKHAKQIIGDVQLKLDKCPTPNQLTEFAIASVPRHERDFIPRKRTADEKPWHGDGMFEIWTKRDLALNQNYADHGKTKQSRELAKQMLAGFHEYQMRTQKGFATAEESGTMPWNPDVRCHVCNDSGFEYIEIPDPGCVGTVRKCNCRNLFRSESAT
jgi:hypothetical protein